MLLNWKVDINQLDGKTFTPLMTAAQYGMGQIASYLIGKASKIISAALFFFGDDKIGRHF